MNILTDNIKKEREYEGLISAVYSEASEKHPRKIVTTGLCEGARISFLISLARDYRARFGHGFLLIVPDEKEGQKFFEACRESGICAVMYPSRDFVFHNMTFSHELEYERLSALSSIIHGRYDIIIATPDAALQYTVPPHILSESAVRIAEGGEIPMELLGNCLIKNGYVRVDMVEGPGQYAVRGDIADIYPPNCENPVRIQFFGDEIDRISEVNAVTGVPERILNHVAIYPASHYVTTKDKLARALAEIEAEMWKQVEFFQSQGKAIEAQRIRQRTQYDMEMIRELGYCQGIENYSRVIAERPAGSPPMTLLDYFPDDFLLFIDESHVTLPQVRAMYNGDRARKTTLVDYGFRLPCAYDNRPLKFEEFEQRLNQVVYVSATPGAYERERSGQLVEQIIRPTGLLDPLIEVRPVTGQIDDLLAEIQARSARKERVLVTTLTIKMAEDLTEYLIKAGVKAKYMHHSIKTIERTEIIRDLRLGVFDVLVGINLLREGLDLPEVSLVAILDADKEGFLRSETALIQTIGRAARNADGMVILYADKITPSMDRAITVTEERRAKQDAFNKAHGIVPKTIQKDIRDLLELSKPVEESHKKGKLTAQERAAHIAQLEKAMKEAASRLEFELAAALRDQIIELKGQS